MALRRSTSPVEPVGVSLPSAKACACTWQPAQACVWLPDSRLS
jgi:hypothetical protein